MACSSSRPRGEGFLPQCMLGSIPPSVGLDAHTPPGGVGLEIPPARPAPTSPVGVGLETPLPRFGPGDPSQTPQSPPWVWAWRPPQPLPGCGPGDPLPPVNRMTDRKV